MHKILLEEGEKPIIDGKKRLKPITKEIVRKKIIKWLDVGIIYPISNNSWVSLAQCVPKKRKTMVVENKIEQVNLVGPFFATIHGLDVGPTCGKGVLLLFRWVPGIKPNSCSLGGPT
ncbi:RNA-directed DNA polymerase-like protein [Gossypium australe]|uniref:RNA-directed DNA polymerase-like protein n=1 Tax=Gossypium australe TaxID=47621 RepID=A0A5B6WEF3_9ROSI|nr:RNA-directed DNA polymerase-like protein [Gossypium australe]